MYKETLRQYSNIHKGGYPLAPDRYLSQSSRNPILLFNPEDKSSGIIGKFQKAFAGNDIIIEAKKAAIEKVRSRQNFIKRRRPLKGHELGDTKVISFEYGNYGYVVDFNDIERENDHLKVIQISKYREMPYYRIDLEINDYGGYDSLDGAGEISYVLYETPEDFRSGKPTLQSFNTYSCIQVAVKLLSNVSKKTFGVNYTFSYS